MKTQIKHFLYIFLIVGLVFALVVVSGCIDNESGNKQVLTQTSTNDTNTSSSTCGNESESGGVCKIPNL